jgi:hypothetical protein
MAEDIVGSAGQHRHARIQVEGGCHDRARADRGKHHRKHARCVGLNPSNKTAHDGRVRKEQQQHQSETDEAPEQHAFFDDRIGRKNAEQPGCACLSDNRPKGSIAIPVAVATPSVPGYLINWAHVQIADPDMLHHDLLDGPH